MLIFVCVIVNCLTLDSVLCELPLANGSFYQLNHSYSGYFHHTYAFEYKFYLNSSVQKEYVIRLHIANKNPSIFHPILVVVKQVNSIMSFQVPLTINHIYAYAHVSRTLYPIIVEPNQPQILSVQLSCETSSAQPVNFTFEAELLDDFDLKLSEPKSLVVSPSEPVYLRYRFSADEYLAVVKLTSDNDICSVLSVQKPRDPVNDLFDTIENTDLHQTVTRLGAITADGRMFSGELFVVFSVKPTDYACTGLESLHPSPTYSRKISTQKHRRKIITITVIGAATKLNYWLSTLGAIAVYLSFYVASIILIIFYHKYAKWQHFLTNDVSQVEVGTPDSDLPNQAILRPRSTSSIAAINKNPVLTIHAFNQSDSRYASRRRTINRRDYGSTGSNDANQFRQFNHKLGPTQSNHLFTDYLPTAFKPNGSQSAVTLPQSHCDNFHSIIRSPNCVQYELVGQESPPLTDRQLSTMNSSAYRESRGWFSSTDDETEETDFVTTNYCKTSTAASEVDKNELLGDEVDTDDAASTALLKSSVSHGQTPRLSYVKSVKKMPNMSVVTATTVSAAEIVHNLPNPDDGTTSVTDFAELHLDSTHHCRLNLILYVSDLTKKRYTTLNRKYLLYFWYLIIISIFYGLPAVQLIMTYQKAVFETGNEDICYYNFECARPLGIFTTYNNILSNVGYVMLGLLFLIITARRDILHKYARKGRPDIQNYGLPQYYGLFYAMGLALTMEGLMSACYHICPNFSNFQFDTAYMYIIAMLIVLKIYQARHPDVNASAHSAYMVLAVVIFLGVAGVEYGNYVFWLSFTIFFLLMSIVLTVEIYYMGQWNIDLCLPKRIYHVLRTDGLHYFRPMYLERMVILLIANAMNFTLAVYGIITRPKDFPSFLLFILTMNVLMYTFFYITMKLRHREKFGFLAVSYIVLMCVSWASAFYFYFRRTTTWELYPAQSRALNQQCILLDFFDAHDVWHFLSAISLFFSFMLLMHLDDDLASRPSNTIPVF